MGSDSKASHASTCLSLWFQLLRVHLSTTIELSQSKLLLKVWHSSLLFSSFFSCRPLRSLLQVVIPVPPWREHRQTTVARTSPPSSRPSLSPYSHLFCFFLLSCF